MRDGHERRRSSSRDSRVRISASGARLRTSTPSRAPRAAKQSLAQDGPWDDLDVFGDSVGLQAWVNDESLVELQILPGGPRMATIGFSRSRASTVASRVLR